MLKEVIEIFSDGLVLFVIELCAILLSLFLFFKLSKHFIKKLCDLSERSDNNIIKALILSITYPLKFLVFMMLTFLGVLSVISYLNDTNYFVLDV